MLKVFGIGLLIVSAFILGWTLNVINTDIKPTVYKDMSMTKNYPERKDWGWTNNYCLITFYNMDTKTIIQVPECEFHNLYIGKQILP